MQRTAHTTFTGKLGQNYSVVGLVFLLSIADDRQKRYFLSMIETNYQKSPIRVSSIILKAHLWPFPSGRSVLLSFPQLGASIPHLAADHFSSYSVALHIYLQFIPLLDKVAD